MKIPGMRNYKYGLPWLQTPLSHCCVWTWFPTQRCPLHARLLVLIPGPQVALQSLYRPQCNQIFNLDGTTKWIDRCMLYARDCVSYHKVICLLKTFVKNYIFLPQSLQVWRQDWLTFWFRIHGESAIWHLLFTACPHFFQHLLPFFNHAQFSLHFDQ